MLIEAIERTICEYKVRFGDESALEELIALIRSGADIRSRKEFRGHVTCGAVVFDAFDRILMIRHRILNQWHLPGGHIEPTDETLSAAARRELAEEANIPFERIFPFTDWTDSVPVDIDRHIIPANHKRLEPDHPHYDFRYVFKTDYIISDIQLEEVTAWNYVSPKDLPAKLRDRVTARILNRK